MSQMRHVGVLLSTHFRHCAGILRGIFAAVRPSKSWVLMRRPNYGSIIEQVANWRVDGYIAHLYNPQLARELVQIDLPVVNTSGALPDEGARFPRVALRDDRIGQMAAEHLMSKGLEHFGFVGNPDALFAQRRAEAFGRAVEAAGFRWSQPDFGSDWITRPGLVAWINSLEKPAGIFAANDDVALLVSDVCRQQGVAIPDEVALIGVDNDDLLCDAGNPPFSSIQLPSKRIGFEAGNLLARMMEGETVPSEPVLLPPVGVVPRRSTDVLAVPDEHVTAAFQYIRENADRPISVRDVVKAVPISRSLLERRFKAATGQTLLQAIRGGHIERARQLLSETDLPMPQVAEGSGFNSAIRLSAVFHQLTGQTPTDYRSQFRLR